MKRSLVLTLLCTVAAPLTWATTDVASPSAPHEEKKVAAVKAVLPESFETTDGQTVAILSDDAWKSFKVGDITLRVTRKTVDAPLTSVYEELYALLETAVIKPGALVLPEGMKVKSLVDLIEGRQNQLSELGGGQTLAFGREVPVASSSDAEKVLRGELGVYLTVESGFARDLAYAYELGAKLQDAFDHNEKRIQTNMKLAAQAGQSEATLATYAKGSDEATKSNAEITKMRGEVMALWSVVYPNVHAFDDSSEKQSSGVFKPVTDVLAAVSSVFMRSAEPAVKETTISVKGEANEAYRSFLQKVFTYQGHAVKEALERKDIKLVRESSEMPVAAGTIAPPPSLVEAVEDSARPKSEPLLMDAGPSVQSAGDEPPMPEATRDDKVAEAPTNPVSLVEVDAQPPALEPVRQDNKPATTAQTNTGGGKKAKRK